MACAFRLTSQELGSHIARRRTPIIFGGLSLQQSLCSKRGRWKALRGEKINFSMARVGVGRSPPYHTFYISVKSFYPARFDVNGHRGIEQLYE